MTPKTITSKDNPWFKQLRQLATNNTAYRLQQRVWLEGDHLCQAALDRGHRLTEVVLSETVDAQVMAKWVGQSDALTLLPDKLMHALSSLPSHAWMGAVLALPSAVSFQANQPSVVLDRLQDPGNAGSILRSAAAFGFTQVITTPGTVAMWSAKVSQRGSTPCPSCPKTHMQGMGSCWRCTRSCKKSPWCELVISTGKFNAANSSMDTDSNKLTPKCAPMAARTTLAQQQVRIAQPGGEESLNVAAAAAICLHASATQAHH